MLLLVEKSKQSANSIIQGYVTGRDQIILVPCYAVWKLSKDNISLSHTSTFT